MAHTPGPWEIRHDVCRDHRDSSPDIYGQDAKFVASCGCHEDANGNAALISVAPDLLDAMKVILDGFEKGILTRNIAHDHEPMWALGIAVQIAALAKGQRAVEKAEAQS